MAKYDGSSIKVLEGLEAVVKRPGMYIGSTDDRGLHHLLWEIVDNSIDEIINDYGDEIIVTIHEDASISVQDNGRGIPVDMHESGIPASQVIFSTLHAGGKFGTEGYKASGGLHGVGSSVVNALSQKLEVTIFRDGYIWDQVFSNNGKNITKLTKGNKTSKTGTLVRFWPDDSIFSTTKYSLKKIASRLRESAFLINGITIKLNDKRVEQEEMFHYENGIHAYLEFLMENKKSLIKPIIISDDVLDELKVDIGIEYSDNYSEEIYSFVNNVSTNDGGTHVQGFKSGFTKVLNEIAREHNILKSKDKNLDGVDIREGLIVIISTRVREDILQFESQTKDKLGTPQAKMYLEGVVYNKLKLYFDQNKDQAQILIEKALRARAAREAAKKSRQLIRNKNKKDIMVSGKLTPAQTKKAKDRELFLVEGDSAGGSAKQGRDRFSQAILPLKGKVVNTQKAKIEEILKNEELGTIVSILGSGLGNEFDVESLQYDKVIIMTDADQDGAHIQILLLTFFYRYMRPLIETGHVYIAQPPLYKVATMDNKSVQYCWDEEELEVIVKKMKKKYYIQRYKGLGEMDATQLWETTMDPKRRMLLKVTIEDLAESEKEIVTLMGDDVGKRRRWIEKNIDFNEIDDFEIN